MTALTGPLPALALDADALAIDLWRYFRYTLGRDAPGAGPYLYTALALTLRDRLTERWNNTRHAYEAADARRACYLSMEYLMGRTLANTVSNLGADEAVPAALGRLGVHLEEIESLEREAGLGNGGLGRLAACFLDSCATLALPVIGYGIRYRYGMFRQRIEDGRQVEEPDQWLADGFPWEIERPEFTRRVRFGGRTEADRGGTERDRARRACRWIDTHDVLAVPHDIPIPGFRNGTVNTLRLWSAAATDAFDLDDFNAGSYVEAVAAKNAAENITMVLYPNDASEAGKILRLRQQYFMVSASLGDVVRRWVSHRGEDFSAFADKHCFQLNDTHPSLAVAELMRLLVDEHGVDWDTAWSVTTRTMAYTNHTLLPEALERWPVRMMRELLPRIMEIVYELNAGFLAAVSARWPGDTARLRRMSLIEEGPDPMVRMAHLAVLGSFSVNGVAALHSRLLTERLFADFHALWPERFNNKTNGVTPRRWLLGCNRPLARLVTDTVGDGWLTDLGALGRLASHADDAGFRERWEAARTAGKTRLAAMVEAECAVRFDPAAMFDVQVKRIHEYKRQLLNLLHLVHLHARVERGDLDDWTPRAVLIGGKAAPGYAAAKAVIALANAVVAAIAADRAADGLLAAAFLPDYRVSAMEIICPGTDLSEQISTAGCEASGTGNMKLMMNGAITIGTLDGANVEIIEAVGEDNFFLFGLSAAEVEARRVDYRPAEILDADADLAEVVERLRSGRYGEGVADALVGAMLSPGDPWMTVADFRAYLDAQARAGAAYRDRERWLRMSIANTAASGRFSSDRTIGEYNRDVWRLTPTPPAVSAG